MKNKFLYGAIAASLLSSVSSFANAGIISGLQKTDLGKNVDLQGMEWLSLEHTAGLSRFDIENGFTDRYGQVWAAGEWRYATRNQTELLLNSLWGQTWDGWSSDNVDGVNWFLEQFGGLAYDEGFGKERINKNSDSTDWLSYDYSWFNFGLENECSSISLSTCYGSIGVGTITDTSRYASATNIKTQDIYTYNSGERVGYISDRRGADMGNDQLNSSHKKSRTGQYLGNLLVRNSPIAEVTEPSTFVIFALSLLGILSRRKGART